MGKKKKPTIYLPWIIVEYPQNKIWPYIIRDERDHTIAQFWSKEIAQLVIDNVSKEGI